MDKTLLEKYAKLTILIGAGLKKGQEVILNTSVECNEFNRELVKQCYQYGAKNIHIEYRDDYINKLNYQNQSLQILTNIPKYIADRREIPVKNGACIINVISDIPDIFKDINSDKLKKISQAKEKALKVYREYQSANRIQWTIVAWPNMQWAKKVFPNLSEQQAYKKLEESILKCCYVDKSSDPIKNWNKHNTLTHNRVNKMNKLNFQSLHFKNNVGTNLIIELAKNHNWAGGQELSWSKTKFNPNIPTEEIFGMPYKYGVNGKVVSTKPLNYLGNTIKNFSLTFKNGKVVKYSSKDNQNTLRSLIEYDEGSHYLGEVAIVEYYSPISLSNILFYETLFDENASCHLALGRAYQMNIKNGIKLKREQLTKLGANYSNTHVDFMFGSKDMSIVGTTKDHKKIQIFKNGRFVF